MSKCPYCGNESFTDWVYMDGRPNHLHSEDTDVLNRCYTCGLWSRYVASTGEQVEVPEEERDVEWPQLPLQD